MADEVGPQELHPTGEQNPAVCEVEPVGSIDTFGGRVQVRWDPEAQVTAFGPVAYFIQFLKTSGLWDQWVAACPLIYTSRNSPKKEEILATVLLSILAGHKRYAHITAIRSDSVLPELLGVSQLRSEDSVRRAFQHGEEAAFTTWMDVHLNHTFEPLLQEKWILDIDATVKTLYGKQEEAKAGYNPAKPGRPSHAYHGYFIAALRMILNVDVQAGNQTASEYAQPGLWGWLDARPREQWPCLIRGDVSYGTERLMVSAEQRGIPYLFKLRQSLGVQRYLSKLLSLEGWQGAGSGWYGMAGELQLEGWTRRRKVVVLRRLIQEQLAVTGLDPETGQRMLEGMAVAKRGRDLFEYAVLVTTCPIDEILSVAQLYRDRADAENIFDEMKNQWGWTGFSTQDLRRSQLLARIIALVFNWWSLYTRMAIPRRHTEAITSRPLLLHGIARKTRHSQQQRLTITSHHGKATKVQQALEAVSAFLSRFRQSTEHLQQPERWALLLRSILREFYRKATPSEPLPAPS